MANGRWQAIAVIAGNAGIAEIAVNAGNAVIAVIAKSAVNENRRNEF